MLTCSSAAAVAGRAAGIGPPDPGAGRAPGQWPETSAACAVMPSMAAASAICTSWVPPGGTGREPGTKPSGSDQ